MMNRIFIFLFALGALSSCKKDSNKPADFRDVWRGQYQCVNTVNCYGPCGSCSSTRDTIISVDYGTTDTTLLVLGREVWLDSLGNYYAYHYGLSFRDDSIFSTYMSGGLGCGSYIRYTGVKISDTP